MVFGFYGGNVAVRPGLFCCLVFGVECSVGYVGYLCVELRGRFRVYVGWVDFCCLVVLMVVYGC